MISTDTFSEKSPFRLVHNGDSGLNYNLNNTTPDLLKFQLQEQQRNSLKEIEEDQHGRPNLALLEQNLMKSSYDEHLQENIEQGHVNLEDDIPSDESSSDSPQGAMSSSQSKPNYVNLKILIENSAFDIRNIGKDSILSLNSLNRLKQSIKEKEELLLYLISKYQISESFFSKIIDSPERLEKLEMDVPFLFKIIRSTNKLQKQLYESLQELNELKSKLNNHNLSCLTLGYIEDIKLNSSTNAPLSSQENSLYPASRNYSMLKDNDVNTEEIYSSFESLLSHIASVAVRNEATLPPPPEDEAFDARVEWAKECINSIMSTKSLSTPNTPFNDKHIGNTTEQSLKNDFRNDHSFFSESSVLSMSSKDVNSDKLISEYKTALNDLRFSHQYLTKEYEFAKENALQLIKDYRKKNTGLEKEIQLLRKASISGLSKGTQFTEELESKDKEISKLRKELHALKIETLGIVNNPSKVSPPDLKRSSNVMLEKPSMEVKSPISEDGSLNTLGSSRSSYNTNSTSSGILKKEFKKILEDVQDQYELELAEERLKRKELQDKIENLKAP